MQTRYAILKRTIPALLAALMIVGVAMRASAGAAPAPTNCNPIGFLESVYQDLLGRDITPGEKTLLLTFLNRGGSHAQVAQVVLNSAEYRTKLVKGFYQQFLGRAASDPEINFFLGALQQGATVDQVIASIVSSTEYYQNRGGGTTGGFLEQLFKDLLGRPIDEGSRSFLIGLLHRGGTLLQVAQVVLGSSEYRSGQIQSFFKTLLGREADANELNFFLALWQKGVRREQILAQIIGSAEYCELAGHPSRSNHP